MEIGDYLYIQLFLEYNANCNKQRMVGTDKPSSHHFISELEFHMQNGWCPLLEAEWVVSSVGGRMGGVLCWRQNGWCPLLEAEWVVSSVGGRMGGVLCWRQNGWCPLLEAEWVVSSLECARASASMCKSLG